MPGLPDFSVFSAKVKKFKALAQKLPPTVPKGSADDKIFQVFQSVEESSNPQEHWEIFNRRMDALFGNDLRDSNGRLKYVKSGKLGMDLVITYLDSCVTDPNATLIWDLASIKVDRLIEEFTVLIASATSAKKPLNPTSEKPLKPIRKKAAAAANKLSAIHVPSDNEDSEDENYAPPKRPREEPDLNNPEGVYDSDGREIEELTEAGEHRERKRAKKSGTTAAEKLADKILQPKSKKKKVPLPKKAAKTKKSSKRDSSPAVIELEDSGEESDGLTALKKVNAEMEKSQAARRGPSNHSMEHFLPPVPVIDKHSGEKHWEFACKYCDKLRTFERTIDGNNITFDDEPSLPKLNNLATHIKDCKRTKVKPTADGETPISEQFNLKISADMMTEYLRQGELNPAIVPTQAGFLRLFSAWILDESLPWTTGEAPTLKTLFEYLNVHYQLPSDTTVRNQLAKIFQELHGKVVCEFSNVKSKIAYAEDTWTTRQMVYTFACTIGCFVSEDWKLIERVVDFKPLDIDQNKGVAAGVEFVKGAAERGGLKNFISLTTDNASVNDVVVETTGRLLLARYGIPFTPDMHIRCTAHIINLVVQSFLHALDEGDDPETEDWYDLNKNAPLHYNIAEDPEQIALDNEVFESTLPAAAGADDSESATASDEEQVEEFTADETIVETAAGKGPITRLRFIVTKILSSPQRRQHFKKISANEYGAQSKAAKLMVMRDVRTRWNYTHAMICRALLLKDAIDTWLFKTKDLREVMLNKSDWTFLSEVADCLEVFTKATLKMSLSSTPTIPYVLPVFQSMHAKLKSLGSTNDPKVPLSIRLAAKPAFAKLEKYRVKALANQYYKLGTILHPSLRTEWFRCLAPKDDIEARTNEYEKATALFRHIATIYHNEKPVPVPSEQATASQASQPLTTLSGSSTGAAAASADFLDDFLNVEIDHVVQVDLQTPEEKFEDEMRRYLRFDGGIGDKKDPLGWWKTHEASFPTIARMARDFLAIPATSVAVERTFSKSRHICADLRMSLKAETIREALLAKVWIRNGLLEKNPPTVRKRKHGENVKST